MKQVKFVLAAWGLIMLLLAVSTVQASESGSGSPDGWWSTFRQNVEHTWQAPEYYDVYVPAITWHARFAYDKEKTDRYNENPWGLGMGVSRYDEKNNWHGLYMMMFQDSFRKWEPIAGYGWEMRWYHFDNRFSAGLGYTVGLTARDNWRYIPLPVILPLASVNYQQMSFQMTYIPGTYNNGNVYFAWLTVKL